jgi:hypothetical protein
MTAPALRSAPQASAVPEYDVALSFLARDQGIAGELEARLAGGLKVFYFPRTQERLAGTDGLETMRAPFVAGSRVTVVLYREPWGSTPWTRVEEAAIKDGCLARGFATLVFVQLDTAGKLPACLPHTHVRFVLEDYGIDQLVGAIKARVQEQGGVVAKPNAAARARAVQSEAELLTDKQNFFRNRGWIEGFVHKSVEVAVRRAAELVLENGQGWNPPLRAGLRLHQCVFTDGRVSLAAGWRQGIYNDVTRDAGFSIMHYRGYVPEPGERMMYAFEPEKLSERRFLPELTASRELMWVEQKTPEMLSTEDLANEIAMSFFDLVGKVNRGEVELPFG